MDWLREQGPRQGAASCGDREADRGCGRGVVDGNVGVIVELNCNTDFVAKGSDFTARCSPTSRSSWPRNGDADVAALPFEGSTVGETLPQLAAKLGENVELGRVVRFETADGLLDAYKHIQNDRGTIGVLVELGGVDPSSAEAREVAHEIALHVSFAAPAYLARDEVPGRRDRARARGASRRRAATRACPRPSSEDAVEGRLNGFYKDVLLLEQPSVKDPKVSIGKLVEGLGGGATLARFARVKVGED